MNIAMINQYALPPLSAGGTRHAEMAAGLSKNGHRVSLIAQNLSYLTGKRLFDTGGIVSVKKNHFSMYFLPVFKGNSALVRLLNWFVFPVQLFRLRSIIKNADVVLASTPSLFAAFGALKIAAYYRKRFVLEVRDIWPEILLEAGISKYNPVVIMMRKIADILYSHADSIITLSQGQNRYIQKLTGRTETVTIYNGPSDEVLGDCEPHSDLKGFNVVYSGALGYANDMENIVEACKLLKSYTDIKVHIIGDGPYREKLKTWRAKYELKNLVIHGAMPKQKAFAFMSQCQVGLLTLRDLPMFRYGVSPNKLFDYLSLGLFVLSTVRGEIEGIVKESRSGITISPSRPEELSEAILNAYRMYIEHGNSMQTLPGKEYVMKHFSRQLQIKRLLDVLLNSGSAGGFQVDETHNTGKDNINPRAD